MFVLTLQFWIPQNSCFRLPLEVTSTLYTKTRVVVLSQRTAICYKTHAPDLLLALTKRKMVTMLQTTVKPRIYSYKGVVPAMLEASLHKASILSFINQEKGNCKSNMCLSSPEVVTGTRSRMIPLSSDRKLS